MSPNPLALLKMQVNDPHPAVRLEAVRAASFFQTTEAAEIALESLNHPQDRFLHLHARPDDEDAEAVHQVMPALLLGCPAVAWPAVSHWRRTARRARILLDQPPRAVEYQLGRLTNDELVRVERKDDDVRYRPVYFALLTRKGLPRPVP